MIKKAKYSFYNEKFGFQSNKGVKNFDEKGDNLESSPGKVKKMWEEVREYTKTSNSLTPQSIIYKGDCINRPKDIANIANHFFSSKIKKIRSNFRVHGINSIQILEKLLPRNKNEFKLPLLTVEDTRKLIKNAKNSWTLCGNDISMNIIKKLNDRISPHITHLFNCIIRSGTYPEIVQISKILPLLKPKKDKFEIESYRPVNVMGPVEKLFQEHIKIHLTEFLSQNGVILESHHGGIKYHGTDTALVTVMNQLYENRDKKLNSCILQTDLSSAFDTIDHTILIERLDYYGVRGMELNILCNMMNNRRQFVELDTFPSTVTKSLNCSVMQGSKLSALLYSIYTNEIPMLCKIMTDDELYNKITGGKIRNEFDARIYEKLNHFTINYIDDSTNINSHKDCKLLEKYLFQFYVLLESYYSINKLKINDDKTVLVVIDGGNNPSEVSKISFFCGKI